MPLFMAKITGLAEIALGGTPVFLPELCHSRMRDIRDRTFAMRAGSGRTGRTSNCLDRNNAPSHPNR